MHRYKYYVFCICILKQFIFTLVPWTLKGFAEHSVVYVQDIFTGISRKPVCWWLTSNGYIADALSVVNLPALMASRKRIQWSSHQMCAVYTCKRHNILKPSCQIFCECAHMYSTVLAFWQVLAPSAGYLDIKSLGDRFSFDGTAQESRSMHRDNSTSLLLLSPYWLIQLVYVAAGLQLAVNFY